MRRHPLLAAALAAALVIATPTMATPDATSARGRTIAARITREGWRPGAAAPASATAAGVGFSLWAKSRLGPLNVVVFSSSDDASSAAAARALSSAR